MITQHDTFLDATPFPIFMPEVGRTGRLFTLERTEIPADAKLEEVQAYLLCKASIAATKHFAAILLDDGVWQGDPAGEPLVVGRETYDEMLDCGVKTNAEVIDTIVSEFYTDEDGEQSTRMAFVSPRALLAGTSDAIDITYDLEFLVEDDKVTLNMWLDFDIDASKAGLSL